MAIVASHCRDHLENASTLYVKTSKALPFTLFPPRSLSFRCDPTVADYPPPLLRVNFDCRDVSSPIPPILPDSGRSSFRSAFVHVAERSISWLMRPVDEKLPAPVDDRTPRRGGWNRSTGPRLSGYRVTLIRRGQKTSVRVHRVQFLANRPSPLRGRFISREFSPEQTEVNRARPAGCANRESRGEERTAAVLHPTIAQCRVG